MREKLSVRKVYRNAYRYVMSHLFAFAFLTIFYFIGSLPALLFDVAAQPYQAFSLVYMYVFFYFAAGCYFKQQILWNRKIFIPASLRFLMAVALFLFSIFVASLGINVGIFIIKRLFGESGLAITMAVLTSPCWLIIKYLIIFMLFVVFFIVPSFAFVSEITGRSRSLLMTYVKTKGSLLRIAIASFSACVLMLGLMLALMYVNILLASVARAAILAFVSILYFKMYDFFYNFPLQSMKRDATGRFVRAGAAAKTATAKEITAEADTEENGTETAAEDTPAEEVSVRSAEESAVSGKVTGKAKENKGDKAKGKTKPGSVKAKNAALSGGKSRKPAPPKKTTVKPEEMTDVPAPTPTDNH